MRVECVCESISGYVCNMEIYTATGDNSVNALVTRLLERFQGKNYRVFMDRRYSSPLLFKELLEKGLYPVGTVMANRKYLPVQFKDKRLKKGERICKTAHNILATKWKDKRDVFTLSTIDNDVMVDTTNARSGHHDHEVMKPQSVVTYNRSKAGVDKHDQLASYYPFQRKTLKWWKKMFFWLFQMGLVNAHKLFLISNPISKMTFSKYLTIIANTLPSLPLNENIPIPPAANEPRRCNHGDHFPKRIPPNGTKTNPTRRCTHCSDKPGPEGKKPRKETSWKCHECDIPLCVECFRPYHRPNARV